MANGIFVQRVMTATVEQERELSKAASHEGMLAIFKGQNLFRLVIAAWPKIAQQLVGLAVFNTYSTYFCTKLTESLLLLLTQLVQYAGNKNPFLVTVILTCCQILSMIFTATLTDRFGRRPLTVYPYAVTVVAEFCLGILGCFNYKDQALSSLLVSWTSSQCTELVLNSILGLFCMPGNVLYHRRIGHRLRLRGRGASTTIASKDRRLGTCNFEYDCHLVQLHHTPDDQWLC